MARLPQPGGDEGNWGSILNDYLVQSHKADGTIKDNAVTSSAIAANSITPVQLAPNSVTNTALASDSVNANTIADGSVTESLLSAAVQTKLNTPATIGDGSITIQKLSSTMQDSIGKADTALQAADITTKANSTTQLIASGSIAGGGDLSSNRTLSLVNDATSPGNTKYYGTNTIGVKGYFDLPETAKGTTKRGMGVIGMSPSLATTSAVEWIVRHPFSLPITTSRWRLRITNQSSSVGTTVTGVNAGFGVPGYNAIGREDGTITAGTEIATGVTVPGNADWVSDWVTAQGAQWAPNVRKMITVGFALPSGNYAKTTALGFGKAGNGVSVNHVSTTETGFSYFPIGILDIRVEYEYVQSDTSLNKVGVLWGHSVDAVSPNPSDASVQYALSGDKVWSTLLGAKAGYGVTNLAISAATLTDFGSTSWRLDRVPAEVANSVDFGIITLGGNDLLLGASFAALQSRLKTTVDLMRSTYPNMKELYFANQFPVGTYASYNGAAVLTQDVASGGTTFVADRDLGNIAVSIGEGRYTIASARQETRTITSRTGSAPGPWTHTVSSAFSRPHFAGEIVGGDMEKVRWQYNEYTSSLPFGATGVIDLVKPLQWNAKPYRLDYRYDTGDGVHWLNAAHSAIASYNSLK